MGNELLQRLEKFAHARDASITIARLRARGSGSGEWSVEMLWGREAPDSPMAGGAAYGADADLAAALKQALDEAKA